LISVLLLKEPQFELAHSLIHSTAMRIGFLVLLKTFQRLGYFIPAHKAPRQIAEHISLICGVHYEVMEWEAYDASGARYGHIARIREYLGVRKFDETAQAVLSVAVRQAAFLRENLVDIINIVIEGMVRRRYELPSFPVLREEAKKARAAVRHAFFERVSRALGNEQCRTIDRLLEADGIDKRSLWQSLKADAGAPTLKQMRLWTRRLSWLKSLDLHAPPFFAGVPALPLRRDPAERN
jgi:hypothetical protein